MTTIGLDDIGTPTTLESNKSLLNTNAEELQTLASLSRARPPVPRPSSGATPVALPYPILRRLSSTGESRTATRCGRGTRRGHGGLGGTPAGAAKKCCETSNPQRRLKGDSQMGLGVEMLLLYESIPLT